MLLRTVETAGFLIEKLIFQLIDMAPAEDDAGMEGPVEDGLLDDVRRRGRDVELDIAMALLVTLDDGRDRQVLVGNQRIDDAELEGSGQFEMDAANIGFETLKIGQQLEAGRIDLPSLVGQRKSHPPAPAQPHAQPSFQVFDVAADRRQTQLQFRFRRREAAAPGHGAEDAEQPDIAIADLAVEASRLQSHCFDPRQSSLHSLLFLLRRLTDILRTKVDRTGEAGPRSSKTRAKPVRPVDRKVLAQRKRS